jgi:hypothetical protein
MRDESTGKEVKEIERNRPFLYNSMVFKSFFQDVFVFIRNE